MANCRLIAIPDWIGAGSETKAPLVDLNVKQKQSINDTHNVKTFYILYSPDIEGIPSTWLTCSPSSDNWRPQQRLGTIPSVPIKCHTPRLIKQILLFAPQTFIPLNVIPNNCDVN